MYYLSSLKNVHVTFRLAADYIDAKEFLQFGIVIDGRLQGLVSKDLCEPIILLKVRSVLFYLIDLGVA